MEVKTEKTIAQTLGENLRYIRESRGVTRKQLAEAVGIAVESIGGYEIGKRLAPLDKIFDIANFFNVSIVELTGDTPFTESKKFFEYRLQRAINIAFRLGFSATRCDNDTVILIPIERMKGSDIILGADHSFNFQSSKDFIVFVEDIEEQAITRGVTFESLFRKALQDRTQS